MIVLVSGFGRCGTSMLMKMLDVGGYPVICDPDTKGNSYEHHRANIGMDLGWLAGQSGAIKVLDPHRWDRGERFGGADKAIWLRRDLTEQAKSQAKFMKVLFGLNAPVPELAKSLRRDEPVALGRLPADLLTLRFENILADPVDAARSLATFIGGSLNVGAMAATVIVRDSRCAPDLSIEMAMRPTI